MIKIVLNIFLWIGIVYFCAFGKIGDSYMITLKSEGSFKGTFFSYNIGRANSFMGIAMQQNVINKISKVYPFIVFGIGQNGVIFMKEFK